MTPSILSDRNAFHAALQEHGCEIRGTSATCPWHEDKTPSCSIGAGDDGTWRIYCHVCQRRANVIDLQAERMNRDPNELFKEYAEREAKDQRPRPAPPKPEEKPDLILPSKQAVVTYCERIGRPERWYTYGPKAAPVLVVGRIRLADGKKTFRQFTPCTTGYIAGKRLPAGQIPLYRQDELDPSRPVLVVEGEKCADLAWDAGVQATTSAMGAGKAGESNWTILRGGVAYVWPDWDPADQKTGKRSGVEHMREVTTILEAQDCTVYWIDPEGMGLPDKGDVANILEAIPKDQWHTVLSEILNDAAPLTASQEVQQFIDDCVSGKYRALDIELSRLGRLSKAFLPGSVVTVCADPGAGKSLLFLQIMAGLHLAGTKVAIYEMEDQRRVHVMRALAQASHKSAVVDDEWCRMNPDEAKNIKERYRSFLDQFGACIRAEEDKQPTLGRLAEWVEAKAKAGARVIVIDPVTAAVTEDKPWAADTAFLMRVKKTARDYGATAVLVTHPRGNAKDASLSAMAGGTAYPRFSHVALWLKKFDMREVVTVDNKVVGINRAIKITKARNGKGGGQTIGLCFDGDTLRFTEQGVLMPETMVRRQAEKDESRPSRGARMSSDPSDTEDRF